MKSRLIAISCALGVGLAVLATTPVTADTRASGDGEPDQRVILLKGARLAPTGPTERFFFHSSAANEEELRLVYKRLIETGGARISTGYPHEVVGELPLGVDASIIVQGTGVEARSQASIHPRENVADRTRLERIAAAYAAAEARMPWEPYEWPQELFEHDAAAPAPALVSPSRIAASAGQDDPLIYQNSEFLAGSILVRLVFVESKDGQQENWTRGGMEGVYEFLRTQVETYWRRFLPNMDLTWFWNVTFAAETQYEPINMELRPEQIGMWVEDLMGRLNPALEGDYRERVHGFNNNGRRFYQETDWVFSAFIVNGENDEDHWFDNSKTRVHAELGGPFLIVPYSTVMRDLLNDMFLYGMAQVFWATTEHIGSQHDCTDFSGYLNIKNGNTNKLDPWGKIWDCSRINLAKQCIVNHDHVTGWGYEEQPCNWTQKQLGYKFRSTAAGPVPDIFAAPPAIDFATAEPETVLSTENPIWFTATAQAVANQNPKQPMPQRSYAAPIKKVSYKVYKHPGDVYPLAGPIPLEPVDGVIDEITEEFEVGIDFIPTGESTLRIIAMNEFNGVDSTQKTIRFFGLAYSHFSATPALEGGITLEWSLDDETFGAELALWRIEYDNDMAEAVVPGAEQLQPVGYNNDGTPRYKFFDGMVTPGQKYGYYVHGHISIPLGGGEFLELEPKSTVRTVTAPIPVQAGLLSPPVPNPYGPASAGKNIVLSVRILGQVDVSASQSVGGMGRAPGQGGILNAPDPIGVTVCVYDVAGRRVKNLLDEATYQSILNVHWDGNNTRGVPVPTGVYFVQARIGDVTDAKKIIVLR